MYGVLVWALMTWTVVPWANPVLARSLDEIGGAWFAIHLIYGAGLSVTPLLERVVTPSSQSGPPRAA